MTTQEVAEKYYKMAQEGNWAGIQSDLYAEDVVSIEKNRESEWSNANS